jgi:alanyl aminopeptidase
VPFIEAEVRCDGKPRLHLTQSRYLPLGSTGDAAKTWQLPVCARFQTGKDSHEACTLLTAKEGDLPLGDVCPDWVFPNADAAGYFRFSLAAKDLANLRTKGFAALSTRERIAYGNSLRAALNRATTPYADLVRASAPLADDPHLEVANESMAYLEVARDWLYEEPVRAKVEAYAAKLFRPALAKLGWDRKKSDDQDTVRLRSSVLSFLAGTAQDKAVRAEAKKRALAYLGYQKDGKLHPEAVDENLTDLVLWVAGSDADKPLFDAIYAAFVSTDDERVRRMLLWALASVRSPELSKAALALVFDPKLHVIEATSPLWGQLDQPEHREATWAWVKDHFDEIVSRISAHHGKAQLIDMGGQFCDEAHAKDVEAFFKDRVAQIEGGPRVLAGTLESIRLCAKKKEANAGQARVFFAGK